MAVQVGTNSGEQRYGSDKPKRWRKERRKSRTEAVPTDALTCFGWSDLVGADDYLSRREQGRWETILESVYTGQGRDPLIRTIVEAHIEIDAVWD